MDRSIFIAATGTRELMRRQDIMANNVANTSTPGFRAELATQRTAPVTGGDTLQTRAFAIETSSGADMTPGPMTATGRPMDIAIQGDGWVAIQAPNGQEAYSRGGSLSVANNGNLVDSQGRNVLGDGGPIAVPPDNELEISYDGTITAIPVNDRVQAQIIGRIKLVNPERGQIVRGEDGLFRSAGGQPLQRDQDVRVGSGMIEGSNVSPVESMVGMISSARHYDAQIAFIQNIEQNQRAATQLLSLT